ncbi:MULTISPECIES: cation:proton antiporter [Exiguobacterium]|uniref:cation:proton antiporter n=1 Tax=Exiguobacterium TaxID=33986 RepID=UPI001BE6C2BA|nr:MULTISPECIES: sodium:proton antiporter [Exiguobacterium]MCT4783530.1 sodium:proton antiporter [Exiguobacterium himgiriensis]
MLTHQVLLLLLIGYIIYTIDLKKNFFPVPVILVVIGLVLSFVPYFSTIHLSKEIVFDVFLPALLFTAAYQFPLKQLKDNWGIITMLSTIGLIVTALLLGLSIYWVSNLFVSLSLTASMLLAAVLIPTDPVSVTSIMKESTGAEQIADVVEGESMVNDGTSIVLFTIFLSMFNTGDGFSFGTFVGEFLLVSLGGVIIGFGLGWTLSKIIHFTHHKEYQVMLSIVTAYGGFYLADAIGVSGVLATVVTGIMLSYEIDKTSGEHGMKQSLDGFWNIVTPTMLSILFLLIGIQAAGYLFFSQWWLAVAIFVLSILMRFIMLCASVYSVPIWRHRFQPDLLTISLITWAGIKGSMSVALLLWLEEDVSSQDELLVSLSFAVILISLILQSIGVYPLTKYLEKKKQH